MDRWRYFVEKYGIEQPEPGASKIVPVARWSAGIIPWKRSSGLSRIRKALNSLQLMVCFSRCSMRMSVARWRWGYRWQTERYEMICGRYAPVSDVLWAADRRRQEKAWGMMKHQHFQCEVTIYLNDIPVFSTTLTNTQETNIPNIKSTRCYWTVRPSARDILCMAALVWAKPSCLQAMSNSWIVTLRIQLLFSILTRMLLKLNTIYPSPLDSPTGHTERRLSERYRDP